MTTFDVHHHVGQWPAAETSVGDGDRGIEHDVAARLATMAAHGVDQACVMPSHAHARGRGRADVRAVNEATAAVHAVDPEHFPYVLGAVDLAIGDDAITEAEYALEELRADGLSWHHRLHGAYIDDARMHRVLDLLAERDKIAAIHVYAESTFEAPWRLENLAERHRDVRFLALDAFSSYAHTGWMLRIGTHHPNVWFDTAAMTQAPGFLGPFLDAVGLHRVLLGTNNYGGASPDYFPASLIGVRTASTLTDAQKQAILGDNARKLFGATG